MMVAEMKWVILRNNANCIHGSSEQFRLNIA
jgi:hypothetical protein